MTSVPLLFEPFSLSKQLCLKNRMIMAPMTRNMADDNLVPTKDMAAYYQRRSDAGLIITEGTIIRPDSRGYSNVPGIFTSAQIEGWQRVTNAVHEADGRIFSQIWHVGRVTHPDFLNGELPIAPSSTVMTGPLNRAAHLEFGSSRAATISEIHGLVDSFRIAAVNAMKAGFDGIEIHAANGYLIDQFLHYHTNLRDDEYGGQPENMARFALEVVQACIDAIGAERVAIRLSPGAYLHQINGMPEDRLVFEYLLSELNHLNILYVHTGNFDHTATFPELDNQTMTHFTRQHYHGTLISCGSYTAEQAHRDIADGQFDLIAFGRPFIANPDWVHLLKTNQTLAEFNNAMLSSLF